MADSNFAYHHEESFGAQNNAERTEVLKPSKPSNDAQFMRKPWPLETPAEFQALVQLSRRHPNHNPAWPDFDYLFEENARLQSEIRSQIRSSEERASDKAKRDALRAQLERIKKMEACKLPVSTGAEGTGQEKGMSPLPTVPADPELPVPLHDRDGAQITKASPEDLAAGAEAPTSKDKIGGVQSGNACAEQAKKRFSGRSLMEAAKGVLKGVMKKLGLRRDASR